MGALLFMFIVFFLKHRGNAWPSIFSFARKKVILDHFYFINQLDFDCLLFVTVTFDNFKEAYLELNNDLRLSTSFTTPVCFHKQNAGTILFTSLSDH